MADRFRFDPSGMRDLLDSTAGPVAKELVRRTVRIEAGAKRLTPVDTGRLRSSITRSLERDTTGLVGVVGTDVEYAPHVFLGTSKMAARPALQAALASELTRGAT